MDRGPFWEPSGALRLHARLIWVYYKRFELGWIPRLVEKFGDRCELYGGVRVPSASEAGSGTEAVAVFLFHGRISLGIAARHFWVGDAADINLAQFWLHVGTPRPRHAGRPNESVLYCVRRLNLWIERCPTRFGAEWEMPGQLSDFEQDLIDRTISYQAFVLSEGRQVEKYAYGLPDQRPLPPNACLGRWSVDPAYSGMENEERGHEGRGAEVSVLCEGISGEALNICSERKPVEGCEQGSFYSRMRVE